MTAPPRAPLGSRSTSTTSVQAPSHDRFSQSFRDTRDIHDQNRKGSGLDALLPTSAKDLDRSDAGLKRAESEKYEPRNASPPPQAPPVPAFGSIPTRASTINQDSLNKPTINKEDTSLLNAPRRSTIDPARDAPSGPKSDILSNAPTAPKAQQYHNDISDAPRGPGASVERFTRTSSMLPVGPMAKPSTWPKTFTQSATDGIHSSPTNANSIADIEIGSAQPLIRKAVEEQGRNGIPATSSEARTVAGDASTQISSPVKIPTGPRADRAPPIRQIPPSIRGSNRPPAIMPGRPRPTNTLTWTNPDLKARMLPRGPSIMNTVPSKRDYGGEEKGRRFSSATEVPEGGHSATRRSSLPGQGIAERSQDESDAKSVASGVPADEDFGKNMAVDEAGLKALPGDLVRDEDEDESAADDGDYEFDDKDFAEAEKKFEREMQALEAKRPPSPRSNPALLELLEEINALGSALEQKIRNGSADETIKAEPPNLGLPSPKVEENEDAKEGPREGSPGLVLRPRPQTPPLQSLPFLISGPPTPFSDMDELQDSSQLESVKIALARRFAKEQYEVENENELVRECFARQYKPWRMAMEDFEEANRVEPAVITTSPPPDPAPVTAQSTPSLGRRRGFASEYVYQNVIKESEETAAREEQQRREREEKIFIPAETFNDQKEAVVPEMLDPYEARESLFVDSNNMVTQDQALRVFGYYPKQDDFTPEEHETFLFWYVQYPKRFGEISSRLENRNYQDCVHHYYSTKLIVQYKTHEATFWKSKRGRTFAARNRAAARGQASSLMASGYDGIAEQEVTNTALTEKGRPRRAAAPTFGDNGDGDQSSTNTTTPARRATVGKENAPLSAEKTTGKRARQVPAKEKPGRKPKAQPLAAAPGPPSNGPSPQKPETQATKFVNKTAPTEQTQRFDELEGAQVLAGLTKGVAYQMPFIPRDQPGSWQVHQPAQPLAVPSVPRRAPSEGVNQEPPPVVHRRGGGEQSAFINSYWNVSENQDLRNYLSYYGTDWQAIANHIPSKTHNMVWQTLIQLQVPWNL